MNNKILDIDNKSDHTKGRLFFNSLPVLQRYDMFKYPWINKLTQKQMGFFWQPEEVLLTRDNKDFKELNEYEKHIFTSNLKRQILFDSVQGRAPTLAFSSIASLPELEQFIITWAFFENIHSKSYTHIIKNVYPDPSIIFDSILYNDGILSCTKLVTRYYDDLIFMNNHPGTNTVHYHKTILWMTLISVMILEGLQFYVSFACSWAFAELKKMEGNAKIIKFIARDENLHLGFVQQLLKTLPEDDIEFKEIREETHNDMINIIENAVDGEIAWAKYLFKDGSIIGLNEEFLTQYIYYIAGKRMVSIGLPDLYKIKNNPLPWTTKWIGGAEVQVAPQEVEVSQYINGGIKNDVDSNTFEGFNL